MNLRTLRRDSAFTLSVLTKRVIQVLVQVSNRCNMRCSFCDFWPHPAPRQEELSVAEYRRFAKELSALGSCLISIEGGEPLLRPDIVEIVEAFAADHTPVLFTNGWQVTAERAQALFSAGLAHASVSIDYPQGERHDRKRGLDGAATRAWRAVEMLRDAAPAGGKQVHVMTVLMKDNCADIEALYQRSAALLVGHQVTLLSTAGFRRGRLPLAASSHGTVDEAPDPKDLASLPMLFRRYPHVRFFRSYFDRLGPYLRGEAMPGCQAGVQSFNLDHVGNIAPCIEKIDQSVGNIRSQPLALLHQRLVAKAAGQGCQNCYTACRGFAEALGNGGTARSFWDMTTRMRAW